MTNEKARDFFSAYHENTLESGLCVSFEQKLKADAELKREYDSFIRAMAELDTLKFEEIDIPADLHERISARLDRHIYDRKRNTSPHWSTWLRSLAFAGVGAVAILGAIFALNSRSSGPIGSNTVSLSKDRVTYTVTPDGMQVNFFAASPKTLIITNAGKQIKRVAVTAEAPEFRTLLSNPLPSASVFGIQVAGDPGLRFVALPGRQRSALGKGDGTVVDLAKAVSGYFKVPVSLEAPSSDAPASWNFTTTDAVGESSKALGTHYSVTLLQSGILEIK